MCSPIARHCIFLLVLLFVYLSIHLCTLLPYLVNKDVYINSERCTCDRDIDVEVEAFLRLSAEMWRKSTQVLDAPERNSVTSEFVGRLDARLWTDGPVPQRHADAVPLLEGSGRRHEPQLAVKQRPVLESEVGLHQAAGRNVRGVGGVGREGDRHGGQDAAQLAVLSLDDARTHLRAELVRRSDHRRRRRPSKAQLERHRLEQVEQGEKDHCARTLMADVRRDDVPSLHSTARDSPLPATRSLLPDQRQLRLCDGAYTYIRASPGTCRVRDNDNIRLYI